MHFCYPTGILILKEPLGSKKKYLGRTTDLTLARLEEIAAFLMAAESSPLREASAHMPSDERVQDRLPPWVTVDAPAVGADVTPVPPARASVHRDPLLSTKLHVPRPRAQLVQRSYLVERLQQGIAGPLTLVSAPAGFGKTTLLTQWLAQSGRPVAWLSLEAEDNDPTRFLSYLIAALQTLDPHIGTIALALLHTPPEAMLAMVANDLVSRDGEVLARQDASVQQFLLHTCLLERLSGPLCDAVTEQEGSQAMLEGLDRTNLFVVALDDERGWYRYHHLFAEVLHRHLLQAEPTLPPVLHRRASAWYEQYDLPAEAVQHALAIPDVELAARLIEPIALAVAKQGQISTVLGWLNALPEALIRTRPFLCVYHASLLTFTNQLGAAEARLQDAERGTQMGMPAEQARTIQGWVLATRGDIALFSGDLPHAISLAHQACELLPEAEVIPPVGTLVTTIRAYLVSGDVTAATEHEFATAVALIRPSDNPFGAVSSIGLLARLHVLQGRLRQAAATYAQVEQAVPRPEVLHTLFKGTQRRQSRPGANVRDQPHDE